MIEVNGHIVTYAYTSFVCQYDYIGKMDPPVYYYNLKTPDDKSLPKSVIESSPVFITCYAQQGPNETAAMLLEGITAKWETQ